MGVPDKVAAIRPRIYSVKEIVCMFDVLIKRPIEIDLENNGDDHRNKLETKHTHNQHLYQKCKMSGGVDT